jgi:uncharacterized protein
MESIHQLIEEFVRENLERSGIGAHTFDHTKRVYALCIKIGRDLGADLRVLGTAALLHDIGRPQEAATGISHSIGSAEMSQDFLKSVGFDGEEIERVTDAIRTHRFSEGLKPNSLEGEILSDADKLDAMGAVGVFRAIAQAVTTGVGVEGFLSHADEKLFKLRDLMYTDRGKAMAEERHKTLEVFVLQLREELQL